MLLSSVAKRGGSNSRSSEHWDAGKREEYIICSVYFPWNKMTLSTGANLELELVSVGAVGEGEPSVQVSLEELVLGQAAEDGIVDLLLGLSALCGHVYLLYSKKGLRQRQAKRDNNNRHTLGLLKNFSLSERRSALELLKKSSLTDSGMDTPDTSILVEVAIT